MYGPKTREPPEPFPRAMTVFSFSLQMRSAPVSHHPGNGLKADVTGEGWTVKRLHALTRLLPLTGDKLKIYALAFAVPCPLATGLDD